MILFSESQPDNVKPKGKKGGRRPGAGRPRIHREQPAASGKPVKGLATRILEGLGEDNGHPPKCWCWECLWRKDAKRDDALGQAARRYLWDRAEGKPVQTMSHEVGPNGFNASITVKFVKPIPK